MCEHIIRATAAILALAGLALLLPSTTYQEDPDQEDQEEPKGD